jgi:hypothetical protein
VKAKNTLQQATYLTTYFCWPNKFPLPLPTSIGPTNGQLKICSVVSPPMCAWLFPTRVPDTSLRHRQELGHRRALPPAPGKWPATPVTSLASPCAPHRYVFPFLWLGPCSPPLDLKGCLSDPPHEEEGHTSYLPGTEKPPSMPLLSLAQMAAPPLSRSTSAPAPTDDPSSHRQTTIAPTSGRAPADTLLLAAFHPSWAQGMKLSE